jgi:hypothetical protein
MTAAITNPGAEWPTITHTGAAGVVPLAGTAVPSITSTL